MNDFTKATSQELSAWCKARKEQAVLDHRFQDASNYRQLEVMIRKSSIVEQFERLMQRQASHL